MDGSMNTMAAKPPAVARSLDVLQSTVSELDDAISRLIEHVQPVLSPEGPSPLESDSAPDSEVSDVTRSIRYETERLQNLIRVVRVVNERVEL